MTFSENDGLPARRKRGLTVRSLDGEVLVYDPETTRACCLNAFAGEVLARCDGARTPAEIARDLPFENVDERVVVLALADLQKAQLIEADAPIDATAVIGPSRRDFFRRLARGAAIAVPVVTVIVMPEAAQAISVIVCKNPGSSNIMDCPMGYVCKQPSGGDCVPQVSQKACTCQPAP